MDVSMHRHPGLLMSSGSEARRVSSGGTKGLAGTTHITNLSKSKLCFQCKWWSTPTTAFNQSTARLCPQTPPHHLSQGLSQAAQRMCPCMAKVTPFFWKEALTAQHAVMKQAALTPAVSCDCETSGHHCCGVKLERLCFKYRDSYTSPAEVGCQQSHAV